MTLAATTSLTMNGLLYVSALAYLAWQDVISSSEGRPIIIAILCLYVVAFVQALLVHHRLYGEEAAMSVVESELSRPDGATEVRQRLLDLPPSWVSRRVNSILRAPTSGRVVAELGDAQALEAEVKTSAVSIRYLSGVAMLVGLAGTFIGLKDAISGYELAAKSAAPLAGIRVVLGGLDKAFGTTICGVVTSIALGYLFLAYKQSERGALSRLSTVARLTAARLHSGGDDPIAEIIDRAISRTLPVLIKETTTRLEGASSSISTASANIAASSGCLRETAQLFSNQIEALGANGLTLVRAADRLAEENAKSLRLTGALSTTVPELSSAVQRLARSSKGLDGRLRSVDALLAKVDVATRSCEKGTALLNDTLVATAESTSSLKLTAAAASSQASQFTAHMESLNAILSRLATSARSWDLAAESVRSSARGLADDMKPADRSGSAPLSRSIPLSGVPSHPLSPGEALTDRTDTPRPLPEVAPGMQADAPVIPRQSLRNRVRRFFGF